MSHFHNNALIGASGQGGGYNLESSLRFRSSANAYLERTPTTTSNRKTWTWSGWVKRGAFGTRQAFFSADPTTGYTNNNHLQFGWQTDNTFQFGLQSAYVLVTNAVYRDPSSWYHVVLAIDTTQATVSNRAKLYINGSQVTSFSTNSISSLISQNMDLGFNLNSSKHLLGMIIVPSNSPLDGYMTEVNFVDGQALTADDFGETDTITGVWKPKKYLGTYGTNGFYLPMKETQQATGFNTVLYTGTGATQTIDNVGFSPDLVWLKNRSGFYHHLYDSVRGTTKALYSNDTTAETTETGGITAFNNNGFTIGNSSTINQSGGSIVAWCWDAGSSTVSNTDGSITANVRANPATGFSIVTYTGNGSSGTVGHGLGSAPEMIIIKNRSQADGWYVWHQNNGAGIYGYLFLNSTDQVRSSTPQFGTTAPDSSVISLTYNTNDWANASGENYVAYCFSEVAGYSKFGSYTGNGTSSNAITGLGFRPAFLMVKRADGTGNWFIYDNTRMVNNQLLPGSALYPDLSDGEYTAYNNNFTLDSDGFTCVTNASSLNASGGTYIYMAFADTRDAQFNFDASGNKNNWTAKNINSNASSESTYDIMNDVPTLTDEDTANFATLNPLDVISGGSVYDGNLSTYGTTSGYVVKRCSIPMPNGKFYAEVTLSGDYTAAFGLWPTDRALSSSSNWTYGYVILNNGVGGRVTRSNNTDTNSRSADSAGDVLQVAYDADTNKLWLGRNNTWYGGGSPASGTSPTYTTTSNILYSMVVVGGETSSQPVYANFGQRPFKYTPPTGFKKLNTYNLPNSNIVDGSDYFNTVTYTGNGSTNAITVGFQPDFIWIKRRNGSPSDNHVLQDSVRGLDKFLITNSTNAEASQNDSDGVTSYDTNGFTLGYTDSDAWNSNSNTYVAWNWRGSDSAAVTNTNGTNTSTVSANPTSGFSVVTYTSQSSGTATVGHGLGVAPKVIIHRNRNVGNWIVYHESLGATKYIVLDSTGAEVTNSGPWNNTAPTSSVFTAGSWYVSSLSMLAYCFAEVEGFSKFGSYTGNGSADGPFIYTGFRPAFVMIKNTTLSGPYWVIVDTARETFNVTDSLLFPNDSLAETTNSLYNTDLISNGFKIRNTNNSHNTSGDTFIYMAFAENPFKNSLAR